MMNNPPPVKGPNIRIPVIIRIKGRGFINQGSTVVSSTHRSRHGLKALLGADLGSLGIRLSGFKV